MRYLVYILSAQHGAWWWVWASRYNLVMVEVQALHLAFACVAGVGHSFSLWHLAALGR